MLAIAEYCLTAATILVGLALVAYLFLLLSKQQAHRTSRVLVGPDGEPVIDGMDAAASAPSEPQPAGRGMMWYSSRLVELAWVCLTLASVLRMIVTGHAPFSNQHEFAVSFAWGIATAYIYFERRYHARILAVLVLPVLLMMLLYALKLDGNVEPLVPALQNNFLLTIHVVTAVLSYGAFAVSFAAGGLYLLASYVRVKAMPSQEMLDEIGYRAVVIGFPLLTVMIALGAVWADIAWGRYWSWDPKETAALVTWLIYGAYLHARVVRDWRGNRAAWLLVLGFVAVIFTFLGNHFFGGLHSYG